MIRPRLNPSYRDAVFAPIDADHVLERVAGGNETEVYRSDNGRYAVKLKSLVETPALSDLQRPARSARRAALARTPGDGLAAALAEARLMRATAEAFAAWLGPRFSIPSHMLLARDNAGYIRVLVLQPYLAHARPLAHLDYRALSRAQRRLVARELRAIIRRARAMYRQTGTMPDLYGRSSASQEERRRNRTLARLPQRIWSFLVQRTLLHSHNLLWTGDPQQPIVLVDYDDVRRSRLYRRVYYATRQVLFLRDQLVILLKLKT